MCRETISRAGVSPVGQHPQRKCSAETSGRIKKQRIEGGGRGGNTIGPMILGLVLITMGIVSLAYQGIRYTTHKTVVDLGPIEATKEEHKTIQLPPFVGGIALIGGIVASGSNRT